MASLKEGLEVAALVVPLGALLFNLGVTLQRIKNLETRFMEFLANCKDCKKELAEEDKELHKRVTDHLKEGKG
jgi:hypothetical protein